MNLTPKQKVRLTEMRDYHYDRSASAKVGEAKMSLDYQQRESIYFHDDAYQLLKQIIKSI